jgi:hypothetical protein
VLVLLALAVLIPVVVFGLRLYDTRTQTFDQVVAENGSYVLDEVEACERRPGRYGIRGADDVVLACQEQIMGWYGNTPLDLVQEREEGGALAAILLVTMVLLLAGITFAGHDWNTGSMSNQLLFEPRRERVWLAKAVAVALLVGALSLALLVAYWTGMWATASVRDLAVPEHAVSAGFKQAVLGAGFATGAAVFGFALTMLLRSTVGALGVLFAAGFLCVVVVGGVMGLGSETERFMPWGNFLAYAVGSYEIPLHTDCFATTGRACAPGHIERSDSVIYFAVIWIGVALPSLLSFRARDAS